MSMMTMIPLKYHPQPQFHCESLANLLQIMEVTPFRLPRLSNHYVRNEWGTTRKEVTGTNNVEDRSSQVTISWFDYDDLIKYHVLNVESYDC
jgi:hypothetical protein